MRRYRETYLEHAARSGPVPQEFESGRDWPSFSDQRVRIARTLNGDGN